MRAEAVPPGTPGAAPVTVRLSVEADTGETDRGTIFEAARARARVTLHRVDLVLEGEPGISKDRAEAVRKALESLAAEVALVVGG
jgi:hypothetical protein